MEYGSEFHARANDPFERAFPGFVQDDWRLVRSGRDALKALAGLVRGRRVLLPALCYGFGYRAGTTIRTKVHTDIAANRRAKARKDRARKKRQQARNASRQPQQLN